MMFDDTAYDQDVQRIPGVPGCAKDSGAHIVDEYEQDTCQNKFRRYTRESAMISAGVFMSRSMKGADSMPINVSAIPAGHSDRICIVETCICCIFFSVPL